MMIENEYLQRLKNRIRESRKQQLPSEWICENTTLREGVPFGFKRHKFQKDIIDDDCDLCYVKKLAQCGLSEASFRTSIWFLCTHPGTSVLYAYPTIDMKMRNSQTRIGPILQRDFPVPKGATWIRNANIMQLGDSFLYMSSNSESDSNSSSIDMVILDEYDMSSQTFVSMVNSRMQASNYKIKKAFSTPTFTDYAISRDYATGDMREYLVKCPHCNHWQLPLYDRNSVVIPNLPDHVERLVEDINPETAAELDFENSYVRCLKCGRKLDLGDDVERCWVATHPDRVHCHSYQIRPFSSDLLSIKYLVTTLADFVKRDEIRRGYNTVLGLEYSNNSSRMEIGDIEACFDDARIPSIPKDEPVFLGLDQGVTCTLTLSTKDCNFFLFEQVPLERVIERFKELDSMYNIVAGMVDRAPDITMANELRDVSDGRIMPVIYGNGKTIEPHKELNGSTDYYNINRTSALDRVRDLVNSHRLRMSGYTVLKDVITTQLRDMYRDANTDGDGQPRWVKMTGNDHNFHSMGYNLCSRKLYEYVNSIGDIETRTCVDLVGIDNSQKTLYNNDLLEYRSSSRGNFRRKRW